MDTDSQPELPPATRQQLRREAQRRINEAAQQLQADDWEAAGRHLAWAKRADEILQALDRPGHKLYPATLVALGCLMLAGLALWLHTGNTPVIIQAELDDVALQLVDDRSWRTDGLKIDAHRIRLTNLQDLEVPVLGLHGPAESLALDSGSSENQAELRLKALSASAGARLMLHVTDYPRLDVKNGVLGGRIEAKHVRLDLKDAHESKQYPIQGPVPETLNFTTRSSAEPAQLMLESQQPWRIDGLPVQELVLEREEPPGSNQWVSTLHSGKIRLLETNKEIILHQDDWLRLGRVEGQRLAIEFNPKKPNSFQLLFHGTVEKVETGPTGFLRNLAPTWLEYLYHQQTLALFWSAVLFLWGMFWSLRKLW